MSTKNTLNDQEYLRTLIDNFPFMVWLKDNDSRLLAANTAYAKMVGVASTDDLIGKTDFDFFPAHLAQEYVDGDKEAMQSKTPIGKVVPITNSEGESFWIESYKSSLTADGVVVGSLGYARDITDNIRREREYQSLVENSPNSIVRFDKECRRTFLNERCAKNFEHSIDELLGSTPFQIPGGYIGERYAAKIRKVFQTGKNQHIDIRWHSKEGKEKVFHTLLAPELNAQKEVESVIAVGQDVTESYENQERIQNLAYFDSLTQLPNRTFFLDNLEESIKKASSNKSSFVVFMLDLDGFKGVNDLLGHSDGDMLLCEAARRIKSCVRLSDTVARLGGDEFSVIAPKIQDAKNAAAIADKILNVFKKPILISGKELFITVSIGIAVYPYDATQASDIIKYADIAMYQAKNSGKNNFKFYAPKMSEQSIDRINIESSLRSAITLAEFELHYQPQVNLHTNQLVGVEALLRWNRRGNEITLPEKFISIAEDSGIIVDIGEWVLQQAFNDAVKWNYNRTRPIRIAINLSCRQFIHNNLLSTIIDTLKESKCNPNWITFEITESLLLSDKQDTLDCLITLDQMGFKISLDDFGTGYSALSYLNKFPVDEIKIDKSFVQGIVNESSNASIVQAIISMGKSLGKELVAEGVETSEQAKLVNDMGVHIAQGYYYGKPTTFENIVMTE